jgi:hypothetical protein
MRLDFPSTRDPEAWHLFLWNLPDEFLNPVQKLQVALMCRSSFNNFDAYRVVRDLLSNRNLWDGAILDRRGDLIKLRDLPEGHWNVDTLFLLAKAENVSDLQSLAQDWNVDAMEVLSGKKTDDKLGGGRDDSDRVLTFWWD